jgi:hypothetical protein
MLEINETTNPYIKAFNENMLNANEHIEKSKQNTGNSEESNDSKLHNAAVSISISENSIATFLNTKSAQASSSNSSAQKILTDLLNENSEYVNFFSGKTMDNGFSLENIGYEGKAISELNKDEASALISDEGFFGIESTSSRVTDFVFSMTGDNLEALQQSRNGLVQGFEEALNLFGGELPEISHLTQEKTLSVIDTKIDELINKQLDDVGLDLSEEAK